MVTLPVMSSLKTEIEKLRAEIAELVEARKPPSRWHEIIVPVGEDNSEEVSAHLARGDSVVVRQLTKAPPRVLDDRANA